MSCTQMFGNEGFQGDLDENDWNTSGSELDNDTYETYPLYLPTPQQPHGLSLDDDGLSSLGDNWDQGIIYPTPNPPHPDFLLLCSLDEPNGQDGLVATGDAGAYTYVAEPLESFENGFELTGMGDFNGYNDSNWTLDNNGSFLVAPQGSPSIAAADALLGVFDESAPAFATTITHQVEQPASIQVTASPSVDAQEARTGDSHPNDGLTVITTTNDSNASDAISRPGPSSDESPTDSPRSPVISSFSPLPLTPDTAATTPSPEVASKDLEVPRSAAPTPEPTQAVAPSKAAEVSQSAEPTPERIPVAPVAVAASSRDAPILSVLSGGPFEWRPAATAPSYGGENSDRPTKRPCFARSWTIGTSATPFAVKPETLKTMDDLLKEHGTAAAALKATRKMKPEAETEMAPLTTSLGLGSSSISGTGTSTGTEATTSAVKPATETMSEIQKRVAELIEKHGSPGAALNALNARPTTSLASGLGAAMQPYQRAAATSLPQMNNRPVASNMQADAASTSQVQQCGSTTRRRYAPRVKPSANASDNANAGPSFPFTFTYTKKSSTD